ATERGDTANALSRARAELQRSRHSVSFASTDVGTRGKFENLNRVLAAHPARGNDWLLALDDDVLLPSGFLDAFIFLAERFSLRVGWGLDSHWAALAQERGWRIGIVDATGVRHGLRPVAASYDRSAAVEEARAFLAGKPYTPAARAQQTLVAHRSWR